MVESSQVRLKRTLGVAPIVFLGLAYMSPFAVFDTFGLVSSETKGHVPASYILFSDYFRVILVGDWIGLSSLAYKRIQGETARL